MTATLIVQPHMDDAVLSAFHVLATHESVTVMTVYQGGPWTVWDAACGWTSAIDAARGRAAEDEAALTVARGRPVPTITLDTPTDMTPMLTGWAAAHPGGRVYLPAGAGLSGDGDLAGGAGVAGRRMPRMPGPVARVATRGVGAVAARRTPGPPRAHPEHVWVRDTALAALPVTAGVRVWLYDELPYWLGASALTGCATATVDRAAKASAIGCYASQVPLLYAPWGRLDTPGGVPPVERVRRVR